MILQHKPSQSYEHVIIMPQDDDIILESHTFENYVRYGAFVKAPSAFVLVFFYVNLHKKQIKSKKHAVICIAQHSKPWDVRKWIESEEQSQTKQEDCRIF